MYSLYRFQLQTGPAHLRKHTCPSCHRTHCFTRYIDTENGEIVGEECGICDHKNSCGYHMPPREYFARHGGYKPAHKARKHVVKAEVKPRPICTIPIEWLDYFRNLRDPRKKRCAFLFWFASLVEDKEQSHKVYDDYLLGYTFFGDVVYPQIDIEGRLRTAKYMKYSHDGHRMGIPFWLHKSRACKEELPKDWCLTQCFFGEHLLAKRPNDMVCIVESEKTALVMALFYPAYVWIATGGCGNFSIDHMEPLRDRDIIIYPDSRCLEKWRTLAHAAPAKTVRVVEDLESYPPNTDIADVLLAKEQTLFTALLEPEIASTTAESVETEAATVETEPATVEADSAELEPPTIELEPPTIELEPPTTDPEPAVPTAHAELSNDDPQPAPPSPEITAEQILSTPTDKDCPF